MAIVYQHRRLDTNEIFYIGIGKDKRRAYSKKSRNKYWHRIVEKHGYNVEIIHTGISWEEVCELEISYIKKYGRKDLGLGLLVNLTDGGDGSVNVIISEESRKKISKTHKDKPLSIEHRAKIGNGNKGKNPNKNHSKEWIEEHSKKMKGENHPNFGKTINKEILIKYSGENSVSSKLKNDDVLYIRNVYIKYDPEFGAKPLSIKFNISQRQVNAIINRERWKHI